MLAEAARQAEAAGIPNVDWIRLRAEDIPPDLGPFRAVTLAQSFHWMDQAHVARLLRGLLEPGGALLHVHATTHEGIDGDRPLPHPRPPRRGIGALVTRFLGVGRRPGQGVLPGVAGDRLGAFEADLRALLHAAGPEGRFSEEMREVAVDVWRA